jgi:hypothetical protein
VPARPFFSFSGLPLLLDSAEPDLRAKKNQNHRQRQAGKQRKHHHPPTARPAEIHPPQPQRTQKEKGMVRVLTWSWSPALLRRCRRWCWRAAVLPRLLLPPALGASLSNGRRGGRERGADECEKLRGRRVVGERLRPLRHWLKKMDGVGAPISIPVCLSVGCCCAGRWGLHIFLAGFYWREAKRPAAGSPDGRNRHGHACWTALTLHRAGRGITSLSRRFGCPPIKTAGSTEILSTLHVFCFPFVVSLLLVSLRDQARSSDGPCCGLLVVPLRKRKGRNKEQMISCTFI